MSLTRRYFCSENSRMRNMRRNVITCSYLSSYARSRKNAGGGQLSALEHLTSSIAIDSSLQSASCSSLSEPSENGLPSAHWLCSVSFGASSNFCHLFHELCNCRTVWCPGLAAHLWIAAIPRLLRDSRYSPSCYGMFFRPWPFFRLERTSMSSGVTVSTYCGELIFSFP